METKELTNHPPTHNSGSRSQNQAQRKGKWALALAVDNGIQIVKNYQLAGELARDIKPGLIAPEAVLLNQWFPPTGVLARRNALEEVGLFDIKMRYAEDQDLWLSVLEKHPGVYVEGIGYYYRLHDQQATTSKQLWEGAEKALEKAIRRHNYPPNAIRKRRAVLAYRYSQIAYKERRYPIAASNIVFAFIFDLKRAIVELYNRLINNF